MKVNVIDRTGEFSATCDRQTWGLMLATLAADPTSFPEFAAAFTRFGVLPPFSYCGQWADDDGVACINLRLRSVSVDHHLQCPEHSDIVQLTVDGKSVVLDYELADGWHLSDAPEGRPLVRQDGRGVLYGEVVEYLLKHCGNFPAAEGHAAWLHAAWLNTERTDLGGMSPREVLLQDHERLERDLDSRARQWSVTGACPTGLAPDSAAYMSGPFGRHEIIVYYDMVRYLIGEIEKMRGDVILRDFHDELMHLTELRLSWMRTAQLDFSGRTPFDVIDLERRRIPSVASSEEACIDPDCPLCQMMSDSTFGPTFWFLDGSHMDAEFVFSLCKTREDWESDNQVTTDEDVEDASKSEIWQFSKMNEECIDDVSTAQRTTLILFGIGGHLAELSETSRKEGEVNSVVKDVLAKFKELREEIRGGMTWRSRSLIAHCTDYLDQIAAENPDWAAKCYDLQRKLSWLIETSRVSS